MAGRENSHFRGFLQTEYKHNKAAPFFVNKISGFAGLTERTGVGMGKLHSEPKYLFIRTSNVYKRVCSDDILYIHCEDTLCDIHFVDGSFFSCCKPLTFFEEKFSLYSFVRANRQDLFSMDRVREIRNVSDRKKTVILEDGTIIPISYRHWPEIKEMFSIEE